MTNVTLFASERFLLTDGGVVLTTKILGVENLLWADLNDETFSLISLLIDFLIILLKNKID